MAEPEAISVARTNVEAFNAGDWDRFREVLAPDSVYTDPALQRLEGAEQVTDAIQVWRRAFPDARGSVRRSFASGDDVTLEVTWEGTQDGELQTPQGTIPASGQRAVVDAAQVIRVQDGRIKENHHYFDLLSLLQQIGAAPR